MLHAWTFGGLNTPFVLVTSGFVMCPVEAWWYHELEI